MFRPGAIPSVPGPSFGSRSAVLLGSLFLAACSRLAAEARPAPSDPDPSVSRILRAFLKAQSGINMRGMLTVFMPSPHGPARTVRQRIIRTASGLSAATTVEPPSERGTLTVDDGIWTYLLQPGRQKARVKRSKPGPRAVAADLERRERLVLRNYTLSAEGDENCAGRTCFRLRFDSKSPVGRTLQFWIDKKTGCALWVEESDRRSNTLCVAMFTSAEFPARIADSEVLRLLPKRKKEVVGTGAFYRSVGEMSRAAGFPVRLPISMPGGYEFEYGTLVRMQKRVTACLRYTDGLSDLTVFQAPTEERPGPEEGVFRAMTLPLGEGVVDYRSRGMDIKVVGHLEPEGLAAVAACLDGAREKYWTDRLRKQFGPKGPLVASLRDRGLGLDAVAAMIEISSRQGARLSRLMEAYRSGVGWRDLARRHGIPESQILTRLGAKGNQR